MTIESFLTLFHMKRGVIGYFGQLRPTKNVVQAQGGEEDGGFLFLGLLVCWSAAENCRRRTQLWDRLDVWMSCLAEISDHFLLGHAIVHKHFALHMIGKTSW